MHFELPSSLINVENAHWHRTRGASGGPPLRSEWLTRYQVVPYYVAYHSDARAGSVLSSLALAFLSFYAANRFTITSGPLLIPTRARPHPAPPLRNRIPSSYAGFLPWICDDHLRDPDTHDCGDPEPGRRHYRCDEFRFAEFGESSLTPVRYVCVCEPEGSNLRL